MPEGGGAEVDDEEILDAEAEHRQEDVLDGPVDDGLRRVESQVRSEPQTRVPREGVGEDLDVSNHPGVRTAASSRLDSLPFRPRGSASVNTTARGRL